MNDALAHLGLDPIGESRLDLIIRALLPVASLLLAFDLLTGYDRGFVSDVSVGNLIWGRVASFGSELGDTSIDDDQSCRVVGVCDRPRIFRRR